MADQRGKKVALVTGSSSGIGAKIAIDLSLAGFQVVVTGRDIKKLNKVVEQCKDAVLFVADLLDLDQVDKLIDFIKCRFDRLDILVNNACLRSDGKRILSEGAYENFECTMKMNVSVPMYMIHKHLTFLKAEDAEHVVIVNISSIAARVVVPNHLYSISKACMSEMSRQVAKLSDSTGIFSLNILPGPILTEERPHHSNMAEMTTIGRVGTTSDISGTVLFAIENAPLFNGQDLIVDGGVLAKTSQPPSFHKQNTIVEDQGQN